MDLTWEGDEPATAVAEEEAAPPAEESALPLRRNPRRRPRRLHCLRPASLKVSTQLRCK
jgi:hypothetical protein